MSELSQSRRKHHRDKHTYIHRLT